MKSKNHILAKIAIKISIYCTMIHIAVLIWQKLLIMSCPRVGLDSVPVPDRPHLTSRVELSCPALCPKKKISVNNLEWKLSIKSNAHRKDIQQSWVRLRLLPTSLPGRLSPIWLVDSKPLILNLFETRYTLNSNSMIILTPGSVEKRNSNEKETIN